MTALRNHLRHALRDAMWPLVGLSLVCYFSYHMVNGEHGLMSWVQLGTRVAEAEALADKVAADRADLSARVALLRPDALDADMLDEQARRQLGFVRPDEIIVLQPRPRSGAVQ